MIKVLHFVSTPSIGSGVMSVIMNYYRHIDRSKIQFDFLCFENAENSYIPEINELGGTIYFIDKTAGYLHFMKDLQIFFRIHAKTYLWLHNHEVYLSVILKPLAKYYGISNFIIHSHATKFSDRSFSAIRNGIFCFPIRFMKCRKIACSQASGMFLYGKCAMEQKKVIVINNAIDISLYKFDPQLRQELRKNWGISDNTFVIGHIGRFAPQKNHSFLLEIFYELTKSHPDSCLICIGDGTLKQDIEKQAESMGLTQKIFFLGPRSDIHRFYHMMDFFLLPSFFEGFPVSLIEAVTNGLTCLISDSISTEYNLPNVYCYSLKRTAFDWAKRIEELPHKHHNANLPEQLNIDYQTRHLESIYLYYETENSYF